MLLPSSLRGTRPRGQDETGESGRTCTAMEGHTSVNTAGTKSEDWPPLQLAPGT